jgi:hypothetical protein
MIFFRRGVAPARTPPKAIKKRLPQSARQAV